MEFNLKNSDLVKASKHWNFELAPYDLLTLSKELWLCTNYKRHKSDDGFGKFSLYVKYDENYVIVTICEDGLCYEGTSSTHGDKSFKVNSYIGVRILNDWKNLMESKHNMESDLRNLIPDYYDNCINTLFRSGYDLQNKE